MPQSVIDDINAQGGITDGGVIYGKTFGALEYVTEDWFRQNKERFYTQEQMDNLIRLTERNEEGLLADRIQLSGMSDFALDHLTVLEGDLSKLYEDGGRYVAAVYSDDDYGNRGDGLPLGPAGGHRHRPVCGGDGVCGPGHRHRLRQRGGRARRRQLCGAAGEIPGRGIRGSRPGDGALRLLSYRYYGADEFILNDQTFIQDSGTVRRDVLRL